MTIRVWLLPLLFLTGCGGISPAATPTEDPCPSAEVSETFFEAASITHDFGSAWLRAWDRAKAGESSEQMAGAIRELEQIQDKMWGVYHYVSPPCTQHLVACQLHEMDYDILAVDILSQGCVDCARDALTRANQTSEECERALVDFEISRDSIP